MQAGLRGLLEHAGFRVDSLRDVGKLFENRKTGERMDRRFIQAVCTYVGERGGGASGDSPTPGAALRQQQAEQQQEQRHGRPLEHGGGRQATPLGQEQLQERLQDLQQGQAIAGGEEEGLEEVQVQLATASVRLLCQHGSSPAAAAGRAAAEALANAVQRCPQLFMNAAVLELCCWDAPLAALAALRCCRLVVAAAAGPAEMQLLRRNAWRSAPLVLFERLRLTQLAWRHERGMQQQRADDLKERRAGAAAQPAEQLSQALLEEQLQLVRRAVPAGFDAVLAAVPAAASSAELRQLLGTAAALLSRQPAAAVLLACEACEAGKATIAEAAAALRLGVAPLPLPDVEGLPLHFLCLRWLS